MSESNDHLHDYELVRFVFDLHKKDPLGMLARGQAHIEHALRQFILANAASPQHASHHDLNFEGIVSLAVILGLDAEIKPALTALSSLQTKFVRKVDVEFGAQEADNFYTLLSPTLKSMLHEVYREFRARENLPQFKRLAPPIRLTWFLIGLWFAILADRKHGPRAQYGAAKLPIGYIEGIEDRQTKFLQLLDGGDDFELVVRGHSHLDNELREFVMAAAPQPTAVKLSDYDYADILRLALTLGLDSSLEDGLAAVGALRNKFAHRFDMDLSERDAKNLHERLGPIRQADAQQAWTATFQKHPSTGRPVNLLEAKPRDLVATSAAMLFGGILLQQVELRKAAFERRPNSV
jgi:hypothetical protein